MNWREFKVNQQVEIAPWFFVGKDESHDGTVVEIHHNSRRVKVKRDSDGQSDWYSMGDIHEINTNPNKE